MRHLRGSLRVSWVIRRPVQVGTPVALCNVVFAPGCYHRLSANIARLRAHGGSAAYLWPPFSRLRAAPFLPTSRRGRRA